MAYFRKHSETLTQLNNIMNIEDNWLILINADPDAMASALALKRIMGHKVQSVSIAYINTISRPDNLTMIRLLRVNMFKWDTSLMDNYQKFAIVDSQPHHNTAFSGIEFDVIIDHHPIVEASQLTAPVFLISSDIGSCSTILTELLYNSKVKIGKRLATALQYGIRVDTGSFGTSTTEKDLKAYLYLNKFADHNLLIQIQKSEYLPEWLPVFAQAIESLKKCATGQFCFIEHLENTDILVLVADFFQKVHGFQWIAVAGTCEEKLTVVFRGIGKNDLGVIANKAFGDIGSAGGHKHMARAEIPIEKTHAPYPRFICTRLAHACHTVTKAAALTT